MLAQANEYWQVGKVTTLGASERMPAIKQFIPPTVGYKTTIAGFEPHFRKEVSGVLAHIVQTPVVEEGS